MTLGSYINSKNMRVSPEEGLFRHEYGHTIQSQIAGPTYLTGIGLWSIIGVGLQSLGINNHHTEWYETNANQLSYYYFMTYEADAVRNSGGWDFTNRPIKYSPSWYWIFGNPIFSPLPFFTGLFLQNP